MSTLLMAMMLLFGAASVALDHNLNVIFHEIPKLNQTSSLNYFVEDLMPLVEGVNKCGNAYFCKVQDILLHRNFSRSVEEEKKVEEKEMPENNTVMEKITKNLKAYINRQNVSCSQVLKDVKTSNRTTGALKFWERMISCIRHCNFYGHK